MTLFVMNTEIFTKLAKLFNDRGYRLYMIGGTTRDYLLNKEVLDYDFVSDATPSEIKKFLPEANYQFERFGTVRVKVDGVHVDITTLRTEGEYLDFRHPSKITYVKDINKDYIRRDFTINAIYMDENFNIIDPSNGVEDLKKGIIRFIGDPEKRIKEDPLRILRAERFEIKLNFIIEDNSLMAIKKYRYLLDKINPDKIKEEERKTFKK